MGCEFPAAYLPICFSSNCAGVCPATQKGYDNFRREYAPLTVAFRDSMLFSIILLVRSSFFGGPDEEDIGWCDLTALENCLLPAAVTAGTAEVKSVAAVTSVTGAPGKEGALGLGIGDFTLNQVKKAMS